MPQSEARAWWADVQHVRESIERRRAAAGRSDEPIDAPGEPRFTREVTASPRPTDARPTPHPSRTGGAAERLVPPERGRPRSRRPADDHTAERLDLESALAADGADVHRIAVMPTTTATAGTLPPPPAVATRPARRTVEITGRTVGAPAIPRLVEVERRRPARRPAERLGPRPDRIALWAVLLGFFLILVAATSTHAAAHPAVAAHAGALHAPPR